MRAPLPGFAGERLATQRELAPRPGEPDEPWPRWQGLGFGLSVRFKVVVGRGLRRGGAGSEDDDVRRESGSCRQDPAWRLLMCFCCEQAPVACLGLR